jgi:hypothetical protein
MAITTGRAPRRPPQNRTWRQARGGTATKRASAVPMPYATTARPSTSDGEPSDRDAQKVYRRQRRIEGTTRKEPSQYPDQHHRGPVVEKALALYEGPQLRRDPCTLKESDNRHWIGRGRKGSEE